jgi:UDP-N-acetylmuramoylalanine--D-glutamate ligase
MNNYFHSKLKIFSLQNRSHYALANRKFKKIFKKKKFLGKFIEPEYKNFKKIKNKINNSYLTSEINDENMSFIYTFAKLLKINKNTFIKTMESFKGLSHRFEIFFKRKNVIFINDSKATSFSATHPALLSLKNIYWILGGKPKKSDKIKLSKCKKNIIKCYLIGNSINFFKNQIEKKIVFSITKNLKNSIVQALKDVKLKNKKRNYILLSPAAASFDQFSNFEKRGETFKKLCKTYGRKLI